MEQNKFHRQSFAGWHRTSCSWGESSGHRQKNLHLSFLLLTESFLYRYNWVIAASYFCGARYIDIYELQKLVWGLSVWVWTAGTFADVFLAQRWFDVLLLSWWLRLCWRHVFKKAEFHAAKKNQFQLIIDLVLPFFPNLLRILSGISAAVSAPTREKTFHSRTYFFKAALWPSHNLASKLVRGAPPLVWWVRPWRRIRNTCFAILCLWEKNNQFESIAISVPLTQTFAYPCWTYNCLLFHNRYKTPCN